MKQCIVVQIRKDFEGVAVQELTSCLDQHNILMNIVLDLPYI